MLAVDKMMEYIAYFMLGLSLNLTPCVYPMLTITLSLFHGGRAESHGQSFLKALAYVSGITVMFTSVGLLAALTGEFFGGLLQNFWVLFLMGLFIIALSLSMFGLYTFQLPAWLMPQRRALREKTWFEFFLSGLLAGVVAAPCVGPVVLSLLTAVSQTGDAVYGAVCFLILSIGMGFPYLILGTFSGLIRRLPKSGAWLVWFERLLAVVLFSFGCFYILIAFRWPIIHWLVPATLLGGGIYLGWLERSNRESRKFEIFKRVAGTLIAGVGLWMIASWMWTYVDRGVVWEDYRQGVLDESREIGEPVVIDFYADWCIPCHDLHKSTFTNPGVIRALERFRKVRADATRLDNEDTKNLIRLFGVYGVPTVIFLDEAGREVEEMRVSGFVGPKEFLGMMRETGLLPSSDSEMLTNA